MLDECDLTSKKERQKIWETKTKGFRKDNASTTPSTRTKVKKTTGVINQPPKKCPRLKRRMLRIRRGLPTPRYASSI